MHLEDCIEVLKINYFCNAPTMIWGTFGMGKTQTVRWFGIILGEMLGRDKPVPVYEQRLSTVDSIDLRGFVKIDPKTGDMTYAWPELLPKDQGPFILFLDELNLAPPPVQAAAYQLIEDKRIGQHKLHKDGFIIGAGNLSTDRAFTYEFAVPLMDRFDHIEVQPNLDVWKKNYAFPNDVGPEVIAFLEFQKDQFHNYKPDAEETIFATPRSWVRLDEKYRRGVPKHLQYEVFQGTVGKAAAMPFVGFLDTWKKMPSIDMILSNPNAVHVPEEHSSRFAVCGALTHRANKDTIDNISIYAQKIHKAGGQEFSALLFNNIITKNVSLMEKASMQQWAQEVNPLWNAS